jgi:hypothetical protein
MTKRCVATIAAGALVATLTLASAVAAQDEPAAVAAVPRALDGKPDLSGIWQALNTAAWDVQDHQAQKGIPAGLGVVEGNELPYQPWAIERKKENAANRHTADPETKCYLPGVPRITYMAYPFQIIQTPAQVAILYEYVHALRNVYIGSAHPAGPLEWWMGDSRAQWEGDTLVVDVVHFTDRTWFDRAGNFHSEALHVIERYTRTSRDLMRYEVTVEDPKVFTRPWKMSMPLYRRQEPNAQILEYECYAFDDEFHVSE